MRAATTSVIQLLDTQLEILENLNQRLEALAEWTDKFPEYANEISTIYNEGVRLGQLLREMEVTTKKTKKMNDAIQNHNTFILRYDTLWRTIQENK